MRLSSALTFFAAAACRARASGPISRDEVSTIIGSAATADGSLLFGQKYGIGPASTDTTYAAAVVAQWAATSELGPDETARYLICDYSSGHGHSRIADIARACGAGAVGDEVVQNLPDKTCFFASLNHGYASACFEASDRIAVQPLTPWDKIDFGGLRSSLEEPHSSTAVDARYSAEICGGDAAPKNVRTAVAREALEEAFSGTEECGSGTLERSFTFELENRALKLHQRVGESVEKGCALALLESLLSHHFVCLGEYDPPIIALNHYGRWIIQGSAMEGNTMSLPFHEAGIKGLGQVVQMSDLGLDVGSCYFYDSTGEVPRDKSETVQTTRRKVVQYYARQDSIDQNGHGTHVGGTAVGAVCAGSGCTPNGDVQDGVAPDAKIAVYDIYRSAGVQFTPDEADPMFVRGTKAGAYVHTASWAAKFTWARYNFRDMNYDKYQHENPEFLVVFAAGNNGRSSGESNRLGSVVNTAKNNLCVCATQNKGEGKGELYAAEFSSMGPSQDGRIKPDICAPGGGISSAEGSTSGRRCSSKILSGTSMATPGVAGASLLIRQYFMDGFYPSGTKEMSNEFTPSGTLVKAVILNGGRTVLGRDNHSDNTIFPSEPYDETQGFGLISLVDSVYLKDRSKANVLVLDGKKDGAVLKPDGKFSKTFAIAQCDAPHTSVTLAYFDKENSAQGCDPCIVNRLDLTVTKGGTTLHPNGKSGPDTKNNSQRIRFESDMQSFTVQVEAVNLATPQQEFALVVSGCLETQTVPTPILLPTPTPTASPSSIPTPTPTTSPSSIPTFECDDRKWMYIEVKTDEHVKNDITKLQLSVRENEKWKRITGRSLKKFVDTVHNANYLMDPTQCYRVQLSEKKNTDNAGMDGYLKTTFDGKITMRENWKTGLKFSVKIGNCN
mmetsp:Transcript_38416/g.75086  ORF Transcript_38416/g.75086 Transcript_38416/m.75086 type:complete len:898 (-) Transcript_38416:234-2927(-)